MTTDSRPCAVVLLSGGLDSSTTLAVAKAQGYQVYALTVAYGQRHAVELEAAERIAAAMEVTEHAVLHVDLARFGGSALTDAIPVPKDRSAEGSGRDIPITYVPARNTILLSLALAWAEVLGTGHIFVGVNALDYSGYPDCRPEYIKAFQRLANLATRAGVEGDVEVRVHAPLIELTKGEIIRKGLELGVDFGLTVSCYDPLPTGEACGRCDACHLRLKGFAEAGVPDPIRYHTGPAELRR
jgi:7-cyano-7-deazaguanine synthase